MSRIRAKYVVQGIATCCIGAFVWELLYFARIYQGRDKLLVILFSSFFGLLMASIYLVPLGAILGVALPKIAFRSRTTVCLLIGFLAGVVVAGFSSVLVTLAFELRIGAAFISMSPVCSAAVMAWMLYLRALSPREEPVKLSS